MIYAVLEICGKQYNVFPGSIIYVDPSKDTLEKQIGEETSFVPIAVKLENEKLSCGNDCIKNIVTAKVVKKGLAKKINVFKYKAKKNYKRSIGHRRHYTKLEVLAIS